MPNPKSFELTVPGVETREYDLSEVPDILDQDGALVIGRSLRGPGMQPIRVSSKSELIDVFGEPTPGQSFNDFWRDTQISGPTYGILGACAALSGKKNLTYVRLLGTEHAERTTAGRAGYSIGSTGQTSTGGAYGLFLFTSGSNTNTTGTLGAIFYLATGSISLSGTLYGQSTAAASNWTGSAAMIESNTSLDFRVVIKDESGNVKENTLFNFTPTSNRFIRKVFNTNPSRMNSSLYNSTDLKTYFLGESFEDYISDSTEHSLAGATKYVGVLLPLKHNTASKEHSDRRMPFQNSQTGWFFAQDLSGNSAIYDPTQMTKLFKFHGRESGEWSQNNIKISVTNIRKSDTDQNPYGSFDILVRKLKDKDSNLEILERFSNCNLNPSSENYISRKIGDKYQSFDDAKRLNIERGLFDNVSKFIRVEVSDIVGQSSIQPETLPFGVYGPVRYKSFNLVSGTIDFKNYTASLDLASYGPGTGTAPFVRGSSGSAQPISIATAITFGGTLSSTVRSGYTGSVRYPSFTLRKDTTSGSLNQTNNAFFGLYTENFAGRFTSAVKDLTRVLSTDVSSFTAADSDATEYAWVFSLDDVRFMSQSNSSLAYINWSTSSAPDVEWISGSRAAGYSITATGSSDYQRLLDYGFDSFTSPMFGGFDGLDVQEIEPFNNLDLSGVTEKTSYAYNTLKRSIDILRDPNEVEFNVLSCPGLTNETLTGLIVETCASRKDACAIIDLNGDYQPRSESSATEASREGVVSTTVTNMRSRNINSSYGAAYYPWLIAKDNISNQILPVPPSVAMLGVWSINDKENAEWDAPAGVNRGNLSAGDGGIEIIGVKQKLYADDQKKLYDMNINPIIKSTKTGIVVWGQKTLQFNPKNSALSRINVRRMMIAVKKVIQKIAQGFIFEANLPSTWAKFLSTVSPFLDDIKARFGIKEYKLILDEKTTTPDLIDRNILYAKVFIKPTIVAEYIFLDFTLTNQSVDFADLE